MNLTAITSPLEAVTKHLMDSLSIAQYVPGGRIVDVGCGGGCPGIPLAIIKPESQIILVESKNKKADFLNATIQALKLKNTKTICQRAESVELTKKGRCCSLQSAREYCLFYFSCRPHVKKTRKATCNERKNPSL